MSCCSKTHSHHIISDDVITSGIPKLEYLIETPLIISQISTCPPLAPLCTLIGRFGAFGNHLLHDLQSEQAIEKLVQRVCRSQFLSGPVFTIL
jgi:hypothetical protein